MVEQQNLAITMEDVQELLKTNALAAQQLENIALKRELRELRSQLSENGKEPTPSVTE
jgi:hypothetical protein